MAQILRGCAKGYSDGSNILIKKDKKCITLSSNRYWKDPNDIINSVKTQSQTKKQKIIDWKTIMDENREMLKHI